MTNPVIKSVLGVTLLILLSGGLGFIPLREMPRPPLPKPTLNVIVILADDMGYGDLACYGSQSVETPNLDALARRGMRFSRFYAGSAVCSPSRACLLTGRFPLRFDIRQHFNDEEEHLPAEAVTVAELLQQRGYLTAHIGKWHLGGLRESDYAARTARQPALPGPLQHGFTHYLTNIEGAPVRPRLISERRLYREGGKYLVRDDQRAPVIEKPWEEVKVLEAVRQMDVARREQKPFFLNLWFDTPHIPFEPAPEPHLSKFERMGVSGDQLYFRSMMSHFDALIGKLLTELAKRKLTDNTLILFTSDNGPAYQGSPGPFKGGKTDLHEGGLRVPFFAVWPGVIPPGSQSFYTGHHADFLPTICEAVGIPVAASNLDGQSLLPQLRGIAWTERPGTLLFQMDLYKGYQNQGLKPQPYITGAAIRGNWKLTADSTSVKELFDLAQDHRELYNLLGKQPAIEKELTDQIYRYYAAPRMRWPSPKSN